MSKLRKAAKGQMCTVNIVGVCNYNPETTVLAHLKYEGGCMGGKPHDIAGCWACSDCHDAIDGRVQQSEFKEYRFEYLFRALVRTLVALFRQGVIKV